MSKSMEETRQEATVRLLTKAEPMKRLPMKRYADSELRIACVHKGDGGEFHLRLNENIWGVSSPPVVEVVYKNLDDLIGSGWEID